MLAIQGADDPYGTARQINVIAEHCPAQVELHLLPECGHAPHQDRPDEVLGLIADFTASLS